MRPASRPLVGLAVLVLVAACGAPAPSVEPSIPVASPAASQPPSASPSPPSPPSPSAAPSAATGLRLVPAGPAEAFAMTDPPFADGSSLEITAVAAGPGGWVAGGSYEPVSSGDEWSDADAPAWFSPDGRTWERVGVGDPDLGGPGHQAFGSVVATTDGWRALGWSGQDDPGPLTPRYWSSPDGKAWDSVALDPCRLDVCPASIEPNAVLRTLSDGAVLLVGTAPVSGAATPAWWRLDGTAITAGGQLPRAGDIPADEGIVSLAVNDGVDGWVVLATVEGWEGTRVLAWTSPDGAAWSQVTDGRTEGLEGLEYALDVEVTGARWIVVGETGLALVDDSGPTFIDEASWLPDVVPVNGGYVAVGKTDPMESDAPLALWSADGVEWAPIPIEAGGPREPDGGLRAAAFDGETLVAVGSRGADAMAWSSGD